MLLNYIWSLHVVIGVNVKLPKYTTRYRRDEVRQFSPDLFSAIVTVFQSSQFHKHE